MSLLPIASADITHVGIVDLLESFAIRRGVAPRLFKTYLNLHRDKLLLHLRFHLEDIDGVLLYL